MHYVAVHGHNCTAGWSAYHMIHFINEEATLSTTAFKFFSGELEIVKIKLLLVSKINTSNAVYWYYNYKSSVIHMMSIPLNLGMMSPILGQEMENQCICLIKSTSMSIQWPTLYEKTIGRQRKGIFRK